MATIEMQDILFDVKAGKDKEEEEQGGLAKESQTQEKIGTEEESVYNKLTVSTENLYSTAGAPAPPKSRKDDIHKKLRVYRVASIVLFFITLVFAAVIFGLLAQRQTGMICPSDETKVVKQLDNMCSVQVCRGLYPESKEIEKKGPECRRCDPGWLSFGSSCYFLSQVRETWSGAREKCRLWQADLAVIHSQDMQVFLTQKGNLMYWIGLNQPRAGEWVWVDHTALGQSYWSPAGDREKCAFLIGRNPYRTSWQSSPCDNYVGYICQKAL